MRRAAPPGSIDEMAGCVCFALRKTARGLTRFYDRALRAHRLRATQLSILVAACQGESAALGRMAERLGMDRTTLLRNVRPLVRRRLLEVSRDADSGRTEVHLTETGRALLEHAYPDWKKAQERALESLKGSEWSKSLKALGDVGATSPM